MFETVEIDSNLELPYKLIDLHEEGEEFSLSFKDFDSDQSNHSIEKFGVTGTFEVTYCSGGINSQFECDMTIGNLYDFYIQLENVYECLPGIEPIATLENYGSLNRASMTFNFDKKGHVIINGKFMDSKNEYKSGIIFEKEIDTVYITEILTSLNIFFEELKRIQGHGKFY